MVESSTSTFSLMLVITILWSLPVLTLLMTVTSVMVSGLDAVNFGLRYTVLGFYVSISSLLLSETWYSCFFYVAHSTKVSPLSFLNSSPNLPITVSIRFIIFPICVFKSHHYRVVVWFSYSLIDVVVETINFMCSFEYDVVGAYTCIMFSLWRFVMHKTSYVTRGLTHYMVFPVYEKAYFCLTSIGHAM